jgi:hypothetical protein
VVAEATAAGKSHRWNYPPMKAVRESNHKQLRTRASWWKQQAVPASATQ